MSQCTACKPANFKFKKVLPFGWAQINRKMQLLFRSEFLPTGKLQSFLKISAAICIFWHEFSNNSYNIWSVIKYQLFILAKAYGRTQIESKEWLLVLMSKKFLCVLLLTSMKIQNAVQHIDIYIFDFEKPIN